VEGRGFGSGRGVEMEWAYNSVELLRLEHELVLQPAVLLQLKRQEKRRDDLRESVVVTGAEAGRE
jgi:hypothetical protein